MRKHLIVASGSVLWLSLLWWASAGQLDALGCGALCIVLFVTAVYLIPGIPARTRQPAGGAELVRWEDPTEPLAGLGLSATARADLTGRQLPPPPAPAGALTPAEHDIVQQLAMLTEAVRVLAHRTDWLAGGIEDVERHANAAGQLAEEVGGIVADLGDTLRRDTPPEGPSWLR